MNSRTRRGRLLPALEGRPAEGGRKQTIYYFARDVRPGALDAVPAGYIVQETTKTGMPILKKK